MKAEPLVRVERLGGVSISRWAITTIPVRPSHAF